MTIRSLPGVTLTVRGVSGDVINDGDVMKRRVHVVGGEQVRGIDSVEDDQL